MEKELVVNGSKYKIREMTYLEALDLDSTNPKETAKKTLMICAGLKEEDLAKMSLKEGIELSREIGKLNGVSDFQKATDVNN